MADRRFVDGSVPGALTARELPGLASTLAPRPLLALNPTAAKGEPAPADLIKRNWVVTRLPLLGPEIDYFSWVARRN